MELLSQVIFFVVCRNPIVQTNKTRSLENLYTLLRVMFHQ